jgi:hypothetical protein
MGVAIVDLTLDILHETADAYKVFDGNREAWIPKSVVVNLEEVDAATSRTDVEFILPERLAFEKGLI